MQLIIAIPFAIFAVWIMIHNHRRQKQFALEEWTDCAQLLLTFHRNPDRTLYERVLKLHVARQLDTQQDRIVRLWIRRVLEKNPNFHTQSPEEVAITRSETLFSYLPTVVSMYQSGRSRASEVTDAINETAAQYGATGSQHYLDELGACANAVYNMNSELRTQCQIQLARLSMK